MASTVNARHDALLERLVDSIAARVDALLTDIRKYREQRAVAAELRSLTPRELDDIGISEFEIDDIAKGAAPRSRV